MAKQRTEVVLLCEDKQHERFVREYLKRSNLKLRTLRVIDLPEGRGSGEQHVRKRYREQVDVHRKRASYGKGGSALIVVIDADKSTEQDLRAQLDSTLEQPRRPQEKVAVFVPRRNIETWIQYGKTRSVDEETDYKNEIQATDYKNSAKEFAEQICPKGLPENAPPSLFLACEELNRIL